MSRVERRFYERAAAMFERGDREMQEAITAMLADHSAKGRLGSGATAKAARRIFEEHTTQSLDQILAEAAKLIDHRGRTWRQAMLGVAKALEGRIAEALEKLARATRLSGATESPSAMRLLENELAEMRVRLINRATDFRDGWTAPIAKPWPDRHRFLYALALLLVGALVGALVKAVLPAAP